MSQKTIPNPGTYEARTFQPMIVYVADTGSLCVAVLSELVNADVNWRGKHTITLIKSDGTPQQRRIDEMKSIFGWDGQDPFALEAITPGEHPFEIVGEHKQVTPKEGGEEYTVFDIVFINPVGGGQKIPEKLDEKGRKEVMAKFGAKFRSLAGGSKSTAKATAKPKAEPTVNAPAPAANKAPAPARGGPPSRVKATAAEDRTSSQDEVWTLLVRANPDATQDAVSDLFYNGIDSITGTVGTAPEDIAALTPEQWGAIANHLSL